MHRQEIKSSTIKSAGYEESTETLEIEFNSLAVYQYAGVPKKTWDAFLAAKSQGSFFMACIRGQFEYVCITPKPKKEEDKDKEHGQPQEKEDSKSVQRRKALQTKSKT